MKRLTNAEVRVDASVDGMIGPLVDLTNLKPKLLNMILNGPTLNGVSKDTLRQIIRQLYSELAAYEDSGCAPEEVLPKDKADEIALKLMRLADLESLCSYTRLRELAEADKDGRLVVLPCKVGDTVWANLDGMRHPRKCVIEFANIGSHVTTIVFSTVDGLREQYGVNPSSFGKTVFLTREEAEKALEAMEGK